MTRSLLLSILVATLLHRVQAQTPAYEPPNLKTVLFGGYSSVSIKPGKNLDRVSRNGWTASITNYS